MKFITMVILLLKFDMFLESWSISIDYIREKYETQGR